MTGLAAHVSVRRGVCEIDVRVEVPRGGVTALVGPNGAGKTTVLRVIAGLLQAAGEVRVDGVDVGPLAPEQRRIGYVFQDHLLFPSMTVLENVAFGLRARGVSRRTARRDAAAWLDRLGVAAHAHARPRELSGGQAQRVALARALVASPRALLLDEPLAALDVATRGIVRSELRAHLASYDGATLLVTHDPLDALVLADQVVVVEEGRVVQAGAPAEIARRPKTEYVAQLAGLNLLRGHADGTSVRLESGRVLATGETHAGPVLVAVSPRAVALHPSRPSGSPRNVWPGSVASVERHGDAFRVAVTGDDGVPTMLADVTASAVGELHLAVGSPVWVAIKATELDVYPA